MPAAAPLFAWSRGLAWIAPVRAMCSRMPTLRTEYYTFLLAQAGRRLACGHGYRRAGKLDPTGSQPRRPDPRMTIPGAQAPATLPSIFGCSTIPGTTNRRCSWRARAAGAGDSTGCGKSICSGNPTELRSSYYLKQGADCSVWLAGRWPRWREDGRTGEEPRLWWRPGVGVQVVSITRSVKAKAAGEKQKRG